MNPPLQILVVEDSPTQSARACMALETAGMIAVPVMTVAAAIEALAGSSFDAILLDLILPDAAELEAVLKLREVAPSIPIVVQTSIEDEALAIRALQHGAEDYLTKGHLDPNVALARTVRFAIERARTRAELERLTHTLQSANAELALLNAQKDRFLGIAAHDLRNPLGVVLGYSDLLLSGPAGELDEDQRHIVSTIRSSAEYMLGLVHDLLDFTTIQAQGIRLERSDTDLSALVNDTVLLQRFVAARKQIGIELAPLPLLAPMSLDARKVRQVLENLVSNAVKFSHPGSRVLVSVAATDDDVTISVEDSGVGIAPEEMDRLFRPFSKTSARGTRGERSTGLGLTIAHNIVQAHGGTIRVESEPGRGSTFHVVLPRD